MNNRAMCVTDDFTRCYTPMAMLHMLGNSSISIKTNGLFQNNVNPDE